MFAALLERVNAARGHLTTPTELFDVVREAGAALADEVALPVRLRGADDADDPWVLDIDCSAFSCDGGFPPPDRHTAAILAPLVKTSAGARAAPAAHPAVWSLSYRDRRCGRLGLPFGHRLRAGCADARRRLLVKRPSCRGGHDPHLASECRRDGGGRQAGCWRGYPAPRCSTDLEVRPSGACPCACSSTRQCPTPSGPRRRCARSSATSTRRWPR